MKRNTLVCSLRPVFYVLQKVETVLNKVQRILVDVPSPVRESMQMWSIGC